MSLYKLNYILRYTHCGNKSIMHMVTCIYIIYVVVANMIFSQTFL